MPRYQNWEDNLENGGPYKKKHRTLRVIKSRDHYTTISEGKHEDV